MIEDHKIKGVAFKQTPNISGTRIVPRYLVIHYSGSGTTAGTIETLTKEGSGKSAHLVIGRDGEVVQLASFNQRAWHCGLSQWKEIVNLNNESIGIELVNWGPLTQTKDGRFLSYLGAQVMDAADGPVPHKNGGRPRYWHQYTPPQIARCVDIARELVRHYGILEVLGHDDIAPARKLDPGPAFPMDALRAACFPSPPPMVYRNVALHVTKHSDGIYVTIPDMADTGYEPTVRMTTDEARALKEWLDKVL